MYSSSWKLFIFPTLYPEFGQMFFLIMIYGPSTSMPYSNLSMFHCNIWNSGQKIVAQSSLESCPLDISQCNWRFRTYHIVRSYKTFNQLIFLNLACMCTYVCMYAVLKLEHKEVGNSKARIMISYISMGLVDKEINV